MAALDSGSVGAQGADNTTSTVLSLEANGGPGETGRGHAAHAGGDTKNLPRPIHIGPHETPVTTPGLDVSEFQKDIDWTQVPKAGVKFAYIRATDGTTIQDANFAQNWKGAEQAGLLVGPYHYFTTTSPVASQIDNFVNTIKTVDAGNLPPVIDVEDPKQFANFTVQQRVDMIQQMLDGVQAKTGIKPMLYMSSNFSATELNSAPQFNPYRLWVADYTTASEPIVPKPWSGWDFWQHTDSGTVPGIAGGVDLDYFNGTADQIPVINPPAVTPMPAPPKS